MRPLLSCELQDVALCIEREEWSLESKQLALSFSWLRLEKERNSLPFEKYMFFPESSLSYPTSFTIKDDEYLNVPTVRQMMSMNTCPEMWNMSVNVAKENMQKRNGLTRNNNMMTTIETTMDVKKVKHPLNTRSPFHATSNNAMKNENSNAITNENLNATSKDENSNAHAPENPTLASSNTVHNASLFDTSRNAPLPDNVNMEEPVRSSNKRLATFRLKESEKNFENEKDKNNDFKSGSELLGRKKSRNNNSPKNKNRRFIPPVNDGDNRSYHPARSVVPAKPQKQNQNTEEEEEMDPRLAGCDPKLVERIRMEIVDHGSKVTFDDIAGLEFAKKCIQELVVYPMQRPDLFTGLRKLPKGILLFGPPGTGKVGLNDVHLLGLIMMMMILFL